MIGNGAKLYLAAISDLYSRFIVGWALSAVNDRHLANRTRLEALGIACSMSRRGNCYDNAVIESWFSTVKSEVGERFEGYAHAKEALVDYIEVFHNQRRRHSTLGHISPAEFERRAGYAA